jgi:hypothetical protein
MLGQQAHPHYITQQQERQHIQMLVTNQWNSVVKAKTRQVENSSSVSS